MVSKAECALSDRIGALKMKVRESYSERMSSQRKEVFQRVFSENEREPQVVRAARALSAFLREKDIVLSQDDLLAGYEQYYDYSLPAMEMPAANAGESELIQQVEKGYRAGVFQGGLGGHVIAGYDRVLRFGFR